VKKLRNCDIISSREQGLRRYFDMQQGLGAGKHAYVKSWLVAHDWLKNQQVCWDWLVKVTRGLWIKYTHSLVSAKTVQRRDLYLSARSMTTVLTRPSNCYSFRLGRNRTPLTNGTRHSKLERGRNLQTLHWLVVNSFSSSSRKLCCTLLHEWENHFFSVIGREQANLSLILNLYCSRN